MPDRATRPDVDTSPATRPEWVAVGAVAQLPLVIGLGVALGSRSVLAWVVVAGSGFAALAGVAYLAYAVARRRGDPMGPRDLRTLSPEEVEVLVEDRARRMNALGPGFRSWESLDPKERQVHLDVARREIEGWRSP